MCKGDHSYPGVQFAVWKVSEGGLYHRYFPVNFLKLLKALTLTVGNPKFGKFLRTPFFTEYLSWLLLSLSQ